MKLVGNKDGVGVKKKVMSQPKMERCLVEIYIISKGLCNINDSSRSGQPRTVHQ